MVDPIVFAHRGANRLTPENTMSAFRKAQELGATAFELDVQLSKDGIPVVIHDGSLERTTDGEGMVAEHTFEELCELDAGSWFGNEFIEEKIPSLEEVLQEFIPLDIYLNLELKTDA